MTQQSIQALIDRQIRVVEAWQDRAEESDDPAVAQGLGSVMLDLVRLRDLEVVITRAAC